MIDMYVDTVGDRQLATWLAVRGKEDNRNRHGRTGRG